MNIKYVVLGAGASALGFVHQLSSQNEDYALFEQNDFIGGLCHSFKVNDFIFDSAVHLSFTQNKKIKEVFEKEKHWVHEPVPFNYYHKKWLKHPIINNIFPLENEEKEKCLISFLKRDKDKKINNYRDWLEASYGVEFTNSFYERYTQKYWTIPSDQMGTNWIGNRLANPDIEKVIHGAFTNDVDIDYYAKKMYYPYTGGYESFLHQLMFDKAKIHLNKKVVKISTKDKRVYFEDSSSCTYEYLISSIPITEMVNLVEDVPEEITDLADKLKYSKISIVSVGFNKNDIPKHLWFYIYDEEYYTARVYSPSLKSKYNAPENKSSLQFEIYHKREENISEEYIIQNVKKTLYEMNLCQEDDIEFMDYRLLPFGNVIFFDGMEEIRDKVKAYLNLENINLIGRFGEWEYFWSDQSILSGMSKADELLNEGKY